MVNKLFKKKLFFVGALFLNLQSLKLLCSDYSLSVSVRDDLSVKPDVVRAIRRNERQRVDESGHIAYHSGLSCLFPKNYLNIDPKFFFDQSITILNCLDLGDDRINLYDENHKTVLMYAVKFLNPYLVNWLLEHGADPLKRNDEDRTCLDTLTLITGFDERVDDHYQNLRLRNVSQNVIDRAKQIRELLVQKIKENASKKA